MKRKLAEIIGWYGAAAVVGSYALVSFNLISATGVLYQILNLTGALGIMTISLVRGVKQSVVSNAFWSLIALVAIARLIILHI